MPVRLNVVRNGKYEYIRVFESYLNENKQPRSRVVQSFGRLDQATPDTMERAKKFVEDWNANELAKRQSERQKHADSIIKDLKSTSAASYSSAPVLNAGAAVVHRLWEELKLTETFDYLARKMKVQYDFTEHVRLLTYLRLLDPASKLATWENRNNTIRDFSTVEELHNLYRCLEKLSENKDGVVKSLNRQISKLYSRDFSAAFYDVSTYSFESQNADTIRDFGMSKDKKFNEVQVVLGLLMDQNGIPIDYELHPGNTSEYGTLIPMIEKFIKTYGIKKVTVVADRGLNSNENLLKLEKLGCEFVIAQKIKNASEEIQRMIFEDNWTEVKTDEDGVIIEKSKFLEIKKDVFETKTSACGRRYPTSNKLGELAVRWLITYSSKRAAKDQSDIDRKIKKATEAIAAGKAKPSKKGWQSYVAFEQETQGKPKLNLQRIKQQQQWNGFYAICTNAKELTAEKIQEIYHRLWRIEDCFRVSKSVLDFRPCYLWNPERIKGHFLSCFLALVLEKLMAWKVREAAEQKAIPYITPEAMMESLRGAGVVVVGSPSDPSYIKVGANENFDALCRLFGLQPICHSEDRASLSVKLRIRKIRTK